MTADMALKMHRYSSTMSFEIHTHTNTFLSLLHFTVAVDVYFCCTLCTGLLQISLSLYLQAKKKFKVKKNRCEVVVRVIIYL